MISQTRISAFRHGALLILAVFALAGCETMRDWIVHTDGPEIAKLNSFGESAKFNVRWHASLGDSGASMLQPALTGDAVYGASRDGKLMRLDRASGKVVWSVASGLKITGGVGAGEGLVLIGSDKGDVYAYGENGQLRWKSKVSSEVLSVPRVAYGMVVVRTGDGRVAGLSAVDGKRAWVYERATPALVVRSHAGVALQNGMAYAGFAAGKLVGINVRDGGVAWETSVSQPRGNTELERISDITSDPVTDYERVCAIAFQGRAACYDMAQGAPLWNRDISSDKGMALHGKYLYLSDDHGTVMTLDKTTGSTLWKNEQLSMRNTTAPYAMDNFVVVGDYEGYLHALSPVDGRFVARIKLSGAIQGAAQAMEDGLLVQTKDGELYSLSIH